MAYFSVNGVGNSGEDLKPQVQAQAVQIEELATTIAKKKYEECGVFSWIKRSEQNGIILDVVYSMNMGAYPSGGAAGGYWYDLIGGPSICSWSTGTDEEIVAMVAAADRGEINLSDYWAVGDTRAVHLSAMAATGVGESHAEQDVELVLMHAGEYKLNSAVESGRDTCSFVVGMKDCLDEYGYINSTDTNTGSWDGCARRTWCNSVFKDAVPTSLLPIFKQFKTITAETYNGTTLKTSVDWFALPAAKEIFGGTATSTGSATSDSNLTEFNALFQFDWYKTAANRIKNANGSADWWWERSPYCDYSDAFCIVNTDGGAYSSIASSDDGLSVFGCI